ncbi:transmembrane protein 232 [Alligator sinensis]|uniref:Transmembrane protein 232 n=1 Tax=Alligator sinensis TaxID=38654 RepID=A0A3Q0GM55_ALLSI|nr:transmembrane protein 232 [Alligator sinensis]
MPLIKVPVVQKFGIQASTQQDELLKRFLKKTLLSCNAKSKYPLEVTEEFVQKFNHAKSPKDKESLLERAKKMLARCKRRLGINVLSSGKHVDLMRGWTEALILVHCSGEIQEEALDLLLVSLDQAPIDLEHIPVLLSVAESILFRLSLDVAWEPYLYSTEVKFSKVGFLVFLRLLVFHLSGQLEVSEEQIDGLQIGLNAFSLSELRYLSFPNLFLAVNFMRESGETICGAVVLSESLSASDVSLEGRQDQTLLGTTVQLEVEQKEFKIQSFVWHCLVVWVCVNNNSSQLDEVLQHLLFCKEELCQKNWLASILGLLVLGEAAKLNLSCLKVLMDLVRDFISSSMSLQKQEERSITYLPSWPWEICYMYICVLRDICLSANTSDLQKTAFLGFCDCKKTSEHPDELRGASFFDLLQYNLSQTPADGEDLFWVIRYGLVHNLVMMCSELSGDVSREGLRNAMWKALQKQKNSIKDDRILTAVTVAEDEAKALANPLISSSGKAPSAPRTITSFHYIGGRIASAMCQFFLPPIGPNIPLSNKPLKKQPSPQHQDSKQTHMEKNPARPSLRSAEWCPRMSVKSFILHTFVLSLLCSVVLNSSAAPIILSVNGQW